jgi:glycosyltransferase involved in cell wall biosynthesis
MATAAPGPRQSALDDETLRALVEGEVYGVEVEHANPSSASPSRGASKDEPYAASLFTEVERFTSDVVRRFANEAFDIIHAHDWMTFPAGVALAKATKRPLVVHVHSLEHDRSGFFYDSTIDSVEREGLRSADRVIAVSHYTKRSIEHHHGIPSRRISVVHNGIYPRQVVNDYRHRKTWPQHVVLFLGRVTAQKGPEYFVEVAAKVLPNIQDIVFVLAGSGDLLPEIKELVRRKSLDAHFLFPGFVQGEELEELFSVASLYVMPSVSEPFGLTALEAVSFDTPVVLSKQSGAAEVLEHVIKVDFWDTDRMAEIIIDMLNHPELREELARNAREELTKLHWDVAALKSIELYKELLAERPASVA